MDWPELSWQYQFTSFGTSCIVPVAPEDLGVQQMFWLQCSKVLLGSPVGKIEKPGELFGLEGEVRECGDAGDFICRFLQITIRLQWPIGRSAVFSHVRQRNLHLLSATCTPGRYWILDYIDNCR